MTKPQWLIDNERKRNAPEPDMCHTCIYYGKIVGTTKHRGKTRCDVHECDIHPGCFNTQFSICCADHTKE